ncbi:ABC transporter substrate-binding protein [Metabacillus litoralis]|uniref:ABC transporter substrate-binding protein n=1 Tax=Metabacillus litoralis TaxID=152268 RepID=UPI0020404D95|nr:ABC transporter substrate-binding protein [Metabacillus litoralis]MCM3655109.1 ABC transporter substrate-binding protein [Metabacillus litoralis]
MRKRNWVLGMVMSSVLALSACGGGATTTKQENESDKGYTLKVGYGQLYGAPLADIARAEGFFEEENLEVEMVSFTSGGLDALNSDKIDIALTFGTSGPLNYIAQGADFKFVGGHMEGGQPVVTKKENASQYKSLEDFKGKKIATIRLGTLDVIFKSALDDAGIDIHKDVEFVEVKTVADVLEAVQSGKVDVGLSNTGHLTKTEQIGLTPIFWSNDLSSNDLCCRVTVRGNITGEKAVAYKKFMKGLVKAERVKLEDPKKNLEASKPTFKQLSEERVNEIVNEEHLINSADPNKREVVNTWEKMQDIGYIKDVDSINLEDHFDLSIYEEALDELIKENPNDDYYKKVLQRFNEQNLNL